MYTFPTVCISASYAQSTLLVGVVQSLPQVPSGVGQEGAWPSIRDCVLPICHSARFEKLHKTVALTWPPPCVPLHAVEQNTKAMVEYPSRPVSVVEDMETVRVTLNRGEGDSFGFSIAVSRCASREPCCSVPLHVMHTGQQPSRGGVRCESCGRWSK